MATLPQIVPVGFNWSKCSHNPIRVRFSVSQGIFHTNKVMGQVSVLALGPAVKKVWKPAAVGFSCVFVNWAVSFWNRVDRRGTPVVGVSRRLHQIGPFMQFCVTALSCKLMSHGWAAVSQPNAVKWLNTDELDLNRITLLPGRHSI